ncbi:hypothetical protein PS15p_206928 [Mucor circinelloides]
MRSLKELGLAEEQEPNVKLDVIFYNISITGINDVYIREDKPTVAESEKVHERSDQYQGGSEGEPDIPRKQSVQSAKIGRRRVYGAILPALVDKRTEDVRCSQWQEERWMRHNNQDTLV